VQLAEELQPDLILLDIGLPTLSGIDAARRIRKRVTKSRILFVSQNSSVEIIEAALDVGALGYLLKSDAAELPVAIDVVLKGKQFISSGLETAMGCANLASTV
jgi:DNA-binding NarL/FixJ family response regulator